MVLEEDGSDLAQLMMTPAVSTRIRYVSVRITVWIMFSNVGWLITHTESWVATKIADPITV